jgi:hypothetical protein
LVGQDFYGTMTWNSIGTPLSSSSTQVPILSIVSGSIANPLTATSMTMTLGYTGPSAYTSTIQTYLPTTNTLGSLVLQAGSAGTIRFNTGNTTITSISSLGQWFPVDGSSIYMTDTAPNIATTTYNRFYGNGSAIYNDFFGQFTWRRYSGINPLSGLTTIMQVDAGGLSIYNSPSYDSPRLSFAGVGQFNTNSGYNWFIDANPIGFFDKVFNGLYNRWRISTSSTQFNMTLGTNSQEQLQLNDNTIGYPVAIYGFKATGGPFWQYTAGGPSWAGTGAGFNVGLYVQYAVSADGGYLLASDERIKTDIKEVNSGSLELIKTIPIKSYSYIDKFINLIYFEIKKSLELLMILLFFQS